jgi:CRP/FNR family transcriptional regulator, cyclic AMP receptor protein
MTKDGVDFSILAGSHIPVRTYKQGETIFLEGDLGVEFFVIRSGKVEIRLGNRMLEALDEGDIFGEMALIDSEPRSAAAIAVTDVALVPIREKQFLFLVGQTPFFALKVMRVLAGRLRVMNKTI